MISMVLRVFLASENAQQSLLGRYRQIDNRDRETEETERQSERETCDPLANIGIEMDLKCDLAHISVACVPFSIIQITKLSLLEMARVS